MITFTYGTMKSGKTASLCQLVSSLVENNVAVAAYAPANTARSSQLIESRNGDSVEATAFGRITDFYDIYSDKELQTLVFDEVQFMSTPQIIQLKKLSDLGFIIFCFGLLSDHRSDMFSASRELLIHSDNLYKLTAVCDECGADASYDVLQKGVTVNTCFKVGDSNLYKTVCFKHNYNYS